MNLPPLQLLRQTQPQPTISDVFAATKQAWLTSSLVKRIRPGMRIAVGCGSRGIRNLQTIMRGTIAALQELRTEPFVVAAMGSHGGATADGQRELLAGYGITEAALGVRIVTDMDAVSIGTNSRGLPVWWDRHALAADGVVTVSRVKPHTDFRGPIESGIIKMLVIGLGKRHGADQIHSWGVRGLAEMMPESAKVILANTPTLGGLGIVENTQENTALLQVIDKDDLFVEEAKLLTQARELMGRIPFDQLDVLIVGESGKNYSGSGMDPNVLGRYLIEATPEMDVAGAKPRITRIGVLDLSPESHGNAVGLGFADLTTHRAIAAIDPVPMRMNVLTARFLWRSKLPLSFASDRECIQQCVNTCWNPVEETLRMAIIPNTLEVADMWVSPTLAAEARSRPHLELVGTPQDIPFDGASNLRQEHLFPHSIRARRGTSH